MNTINNNTNLVESFEYVDFSFAFNCSIFSDKIIQLEIKNVRPNVESSSKSKRIREDVQKHNADLLSGQPAVGDEAANLPVKTVYVNSAILAAKSSYFYKLFSNGMRESQQKHVPLRMTASEEAPFMDLLKFMYNKPLNATTLPRLLEVLRAADEFEVPTCKRYCSQVLLNTLMTTESAVLYLELPYTVLMDDDVQQLVIAAKKHLVARYKDVIKHQEELMGLPLTGVVALLSSDELQVASEDDVYDFVLKWAQTKYPILEERRQILRAKLIPFIRFSYMSLCKLKMVQICNDLEHEFASKLVFNALFFKAEAPHRQRILASTNRLFIERSYKYRPVKVVEFEVPHQQCVVYLDLRREECANLFPGGYVCSRTFHLGGHVFFLSALCGVDQQGICHSFGLFLSMLEKGSSNISVDYEFSVRSRPTLEYISMYKGNFIFAGVREHIYRKVFATPWTLLMAEDSIFFINDVLHLRAELTIRNQLDLQ